MSLSHTEEAQGQHMSSRRSRGLQLYGGAASQTRRAGTPTQVPTGKALHRREHGATPTSSRNLSEREHRPTTERPDRPSGALGTGRAARGCFRHAGCCAPVQEEAPSLNTAPAPTPGAEVRRVCRVTGSRAGAARPTAPSWASAQLGLGCHFLIWRWAWGAGGGVGRPGFHSGRRRGAPPGQQPRTLGQPSRHKAQACPIRPRRAALLLQAGSHRLTSGDAPGAPGRAVAVRAQGQHLCPVPSPAALGLVPAGAGLAAGTEGDT